VIDLLPEILEQCRQKEPTAFAELVIRFQEKALDLAQSITQDRHLAEDAVQQAFLIAYCRLNQLKNDNSFPGWFRQIVRTQSLKVVQKKVIDPNEFEALQKPDISPSEQFEYQELREMIRQSLLKLSEMNRQTVELFYLNEQSCSEVAKTLNIPSGTVRRRLHQARNHLQSILKDYYEIPLIETTQKNEIPF
jgi:RNA polymerase sigma-70 factor (ECF subfamily)